MDQLPKYREAIYGTQINLVSRSKIKTHRNSTSPYCTKSHLRDYNSYDLKISPKTIAYFEGYDDVIKKAETCFEIVFMWMAGIMFADWYVQCYSKLTIKGDLTFLNVLLYTLMTCSAGIWITSGMVLKKYFFKRYLRDLWKVAFHAKSLCLDDVYYTEMIDQFLAASINIYHTIDLFGFLEFFGWYGFIVSVVVLCSKTFWTKLIYK